jgi:competence protein ComEC
MMSVAIGFLIGVIILQQLSVLPPLALSWLLIIFVPWCFSVNKLRFLLALACGFLWSAFQAHIALHPGLDRNLEGVDLIARGKIASIPQQRDRNTRFIFEISSIENESVPAEKLPTRVRLNWYRNIPDLKLGQRWRLPIRLKRPWGFRNPGGFDFEGWLFRHGIRATGYVRNPSQARLLRAHASNRRIGYLRQTLADEIGRALEADTNRGVITALAIGERSGIEPQQWELLLKTGTNHLLAISGLHIGLVAAMFYFLSFRLWRRSMRLCRAWPAQRAAALTAILAGIGYAFLAGFSTPTQRAVIMLSVVMGASLFDRPLRPGYTLAIALLVVLVWDSLAVLSASFWLSFAAVSVLVLVLVGRVARPVRWWQWGRLQWVLAIGLLPLTLFFFQRSALIAPLANLIAVPWVGLLVVPTTLAGSIALPITPELGGLLLSLSSHLLDVLWFVLEQLAAWPFAHWYHAPPMWTLFPGIVGVLWMLAPRGWPARWLGIGLLLPLVLAPHEKPASSEFWLTLLDVGQGLSAVIETRHHVLVYDTGARFSPYFNTGEAVIVPFLRSRDITELDLLVISHSDNDHVGGAAALTDHLPVRRMMSSGHDANLHGAVAACELGQRWVWDEVSFEMLHPPPDWSGSENNRSCVLRIHNSGGSVLLTADIESQAERYLVDYRGAGLHSDILLIPHHGSQTSSTQAFLNAVNPRVGLVSAGYRNRFRFPAHAVIERYKSQGIRVLDTVSHGAIRVRVLPDTGSIVESGYRQAAQRYWTTQP